MAPSMVRKSLSRSVKRKSNQPLPLPMRVSAKVSTIRSAVNANDQAKGKIRCKLCHQTRFDIAEIPPVIDSEPVVLTNNILANVYQDGAIELVQHNLTDYMFYDDNRHMCSLDSGLLEKNIKIYFTGYIKPIYNRSPDLKDGVAVNKLGPIQEWFMSTYDGGPQIIIGISTECAEYLLIDPHPDYIKYMASITEKTHLSTLVFKCLVDNVESDVPTYEDILDCVINSINPITNNKFSEEDLLAHAQFIINQILVYDSAKIYSFPLADTQCIETLIQLSGATKTVRKKLEKVKQRNKVFEKILGKPKLSKATTTELVQSVFENMFAAQLNVEDKENETTTNTLVNTVFENGCFENTENNSSHTNNYDKNYVIWKEQKLYEKMFVEVKNNSSDTSFIGRIEYFHAKDQIHISLFIHSHDTVLGEASDSQELFALQKCKNIKVNNVDKILNVVHKKPDNNWFNLGGSKIKDLVEPVNRNSKTSFFYQLQYDDEFGRFEYPKPDDPSKDGNYCNNCEIRKLQKKSQVPELHEVIEKSNNITYFYKFKLLNKEYKVGNFIYLPPDVFLTAKRANFIKCTPFVHKKPDENKNSLLLKEVDKIKYPEYYRKTLENTVSGSNETTPNPFEIGEILAIYVVGTDKINIKLVVRRMYRAEQIPLEDYKKKADVNMLLWSDEKFRVLSTDIYGKCYVSSINNLKDPLTWFTEGPDRFYFKKKYDFLTGTIVPENKLPPTAKLTGNEVFVNYEYKYVDEDKLQYIPFYEKIKPLRGLDVFAGCGGFSKGLEESGLIKTEWAIESDDKAATAFQLNNPMATVFVEDCNHLLKLAISGSETNDKNQRIPKRGEVEFICGGPPCQGFSGMNRFNSGEYSLFKNSLIVTFLSYIDFYRPKYFVMENVRNFVSFKKNMILKLFLRCITRMGYQCTFGILQAGNFGVPQTRRRLIIMGAAPGEKLPLYPEPIHVFNKRGSSLGIQIGNKMFKTNSKYNNSAPLRTVTVYDAWSDLPEISNGANNEQMFYNSEPITHLQKLLRSPNNLLIDSILTDHICKDMSPLVQARIKLIPLGEGNDWRDLPNIEVNLSDGTKTNKLIYTQYDIKNHPNINGSTYGVCPCWAGGQCNQQNRQNNTIIPWCLPHTGNRHNNWAGLYGRLAWEGYCKTTITNPEPMGKQGRVLHPEQHRVVSVRECARSQGFKDSYKFYGPILNKHRQIGNAVPPPMGVAIGNEIIKAIYENSLSKN